MPGLFDRCRRRRADPDAEARALFEHAAALHQDFLQAPAASKLPQLQEAMQAYNDVLRFWTEAAFPVDWAMTMNNLAAAYADLPTGDRGHNLARAIAGYEAALRVRTLDMLPFDRLQTLNNLSGLYEQEQQWPEVLSTCEDGLLVLEHVRTAALTATERTRVRST